MEEAMDRDREAVKSELVEVRERRHELTRRLERFHEKAERFLRDARLEVHNLGQKIRSVGRGKVEDVSGAKAFAKKRVAELERVRNDILSEVPQRANPAAINRSIRTGDRVRSESTGWHGIVTGEKNRKGEWCVEAKGKRAWLPGEDIVFIGQEEKPKEPMAQITVDLAERSSVDYGDQAAIELMLLGDRVEEAVQRVDKHLDEAALSGLPFVRIIHGVGTGALKGAVTEALEGHPHVKNFAPAGSDAGGDGVTVVEIAGERTASMP
jgi:DNA mismatch repair protein MutS2